MSLYRAIVVGVDDPQKRGRVRLAIPDLFHDPEENTVIDSPWAEPKGGGGAGMGILDVPPVGTMVWVTPVFTGSQESYELVYERGTHGADANGSFVPDVAKEVDDESVWLKVSAPFKVPSPRVGLDRRSPTKDPGRDITRAANFEALEIPGAPTSANAGKYPHNKVIKTQGGFVLEMDDTPGNERWQLHHPSGASLEMTSGGVVVQRSAKVWEEVLEHRTSRIGGDLRTCIDGNELKSVNANHIEDNKGRRVILASEFDVKTRFDLLMEVGSHIYLSSRGYHTMRSGSAMRLSSGSDFAASSLSNMSLTASLGSAALTSLSQNVILTAAATIQAKALGAITMDAVGATSVKAGGAVEVAAGATLNLAAGGAASIAAPSTVVSSASISLGGPEAVTPVLLATPELVAFLNGLGAPTAPAISVSTRAL